MKVLIAIDDSPYSQDVAASILSREWPERTKFKILTVVDPVCASCNDFGDVGVDRGAELYGRRRLAAQALCRKIRDKIVAAVPTANVNYEVREGLARNEIVNTAVEWLADRILIGAHGRNVCPRNLIGSVSRAVASHAPCSVEVVRPRLHSKKASKTSTSK